ncbi:MAG: HU family DNA-binding protein [Deltaproteobacteria bacterium]|nr:HU family DNA-binding protein [Deltaproteobacteria bacterium]
MAKKKFSFLDELNTRLVKSITVTRAGEPRLKRGDLRTVLEESFLAGVKAAAGGERVRFPVIGALARKDVKARKAGKGTNPFTGEEMTIKARPASKKPRWSFPKAVKEIYANKRNW